MYSSTAFIWVVSFTRKWTLFSNNTNSTIRMYSTRTFIWVVTFRFCLSDQDLEVFWFKSNSLLTVEGLMAGWLQKTAYKAWSKVQMKHIHGKRNVVTSNFIDPTFIPKPVYDGCRLTSSSNLLYSAITANASNACGERTHRTWLYFYICCYTFFPQANGQNKSYRWQIKKEDSFWS